MSDYFSLNHNNGSSTLAESLITPSVYDSINGYGPFDEESMQSSESQLLLDLYHNDPAAILDSNYSFNLHQGAPHLQGKDSILPRTNKKSPFYTSVPIPKPVKLSASLDIDDHDGYTENDIYDGENNFVKEYPTVVLADRFYKWKKILKALINYLKEMAYAQEEFARINTQMKDAVKFKFLTDLDEQTNTLVDPMTHTRPMRKQQPMTLAEKKKQSNLSSSNLNDSSSFNPASSQFTLNKDLNNPLAASGFMNFGSGSIQDIQIILKKYHLSLANQQYKVSKEIANNLIPQLESLRKDLSMKVKDIKSLHDNFKTNINDHIKITSQLLNKYITACRVMSNPKFSAKGIKPKHDPFLLKLQLDLQLKRQIEEENYLRTAFINLQSAGMKLEKIIYAKVQHTLQSYSSLLGSEAQLVLRILCQELYKGICSNPPAIEWDKFVTCHGKCLINWKSNDPVPPERSFSDIEYPRANSPMGKCIKSGYLKFRKGNSSSTEGYFILTANYLHEFKSNNLYKSGFYPESVPSLNEIQKGQNAKGNASKGQSCKSQPVKGQPGYHNPKYTQPKRKKTLLPVFSIPLDECKIIKCSDYKLVLEAPGVYSREATPIAPQVIQKHYSGSQLAKQTAENLHSMSSTTLTKTGQEAQKIVTKSHHGLSKLWKGSSSSESRKASNSSSTSLQSQRNPVKKVPNANEVLTPVKWTFYIDQTTATPQDVKYFKKWINDIKYLTSFTDIHQRANFIEENMLKNSRQTSNSVVPSNELASGFISNFTASSLSIPEPPSAFTLINANASRITSPILDDKGNLIAPMRSYSAGSIPVLNSGNTSASNSQIKIEPLTQAKNINNVTSPNMSMLSHKTQNSDESSGGYFALPVRREVRSNPTTPHQESQGSRSPGSTLSQKIGDISISLEDIERMKLPQMKLNNQDFMLTAPKFQRSVSASSIPTTTVLDAKNTAIDNLTGIEMANSNGISINSNPGIKINNDLISNNENHGLMYHSANNSSNSLNLTPVNSRVQSVKKHKKTRSFSSLSSLKFSKRTGATSGMFYNEHMMNNGIDEHDDCESLEEAPKVIKLSQSLYT
ncbi:hypothetical protein Kpol_359p12 [Vanderwaltozyma polyspora DSM 70294]|uniref:PH domain-containing protein n=1 Tax=Vanderwaltozyma polyspora (strain ATCC 22028 / DSM 70294 / BCRC 21397 / CBS 2163 / NBRC 10782 / NRRL Y-8283 / UCD 57-17) TaxID=436907 RepID=A7TSB4_VANPO|nr:uncharacterized protein Kpol_359p12 [Vanderwaltozyma polyspora DSM 70294]EDO14851.1 hypothetical protein Kpol_359p12 [Vanderwaltozyma polyspora DSM 70294]